jgi:hypothetical protein
MFTSAEMVYGLGENGSLVQMVKELKMLRKLGHKCWIDQSNSPERRLFVETTITDQMANEINDRIINAKHK